MSKVIKKQQAVQPCKGLVSLTKQDISDPTKSHSVSLTNILLVALSSLTEYMPSCKSKSTTIKFGEKSRLQRLCFSPLPAVGITSELAPRARSAHAQTVADAPDNSSSEERARQQSTKSHITFSR
jgi:hypothetical protein